jgi:hypothetical protein
MVNMGYYADIPDTLFSVHEPEYFSGLSESWHYSFISLIKLPFLPQYDA